MAKYLTYDELMELALEHYEEGGDSTYECVSRKDFETSDYLNKLTKADALKMFKLDLEIWNEMASTAW